MVVSSAKPGPDSISRVIQWASNLTMSGWSSLDPAHVGILGAVIVDGDAEAVALQRRDEIEERLLRGRLLLGHLADDAARIDAGLVQDEPHVAQRRLGDRVLGEDRRIEIDEDRSASGDRQPAALSRCSVRVSVSTCSRSAAGTLLKKASGVQASSSRNGRISPSKATTAELAVGEGEDRLEGALEHVRAPDTGRGAVVVADDVSKPDAARHEP